jgi:uncharacterized protein DUF3298
MRFFSVAVLVTAAAIFGSSGVAVAGPKDYCADLKGSKTGQTCEIQLADSGYRVNISLPLDYPDLKPVADYIAQTRDGFLDVAKSSTPRDTRYELDITPTNYGSAIPPRGTQTVVFKTYKNIGGANPQTTYKAFNWDQSYRKPIVYDTGDDDKKTPLWRVDDPLKTVAPIVGAELQKQTGQPVAPAALNNPTNYQDFAVTNDGVIFFFSQGQMLPEAAGPTQVLVPRSAIDPMLA